ncbi:hypothetical protein KP509_38G016300 [Ceratopteris richardii]|uniref:Uncharacterized protein n=1 Tax=Ceratopteris richardii TaxID=49495 RepID=A0A8T2Q2L7_CERRI|nr:hypothetical protein KP509_38G016300 [Ceratopteris richardii]
MTVPVLLPSHSQHQELPDDLPVLHPRSGETISPAYIHTVQHLIEKCLLFNMDREECVSVLERHANIHSIVTRTVWNELERENPEFFSAYNWRNLGSDAVCCNELLTKVSTEAIRHQ